MNMHDRVVLVTGADQPFGQTVAVLLSQLGATLVLSAGQETSLAKTQALLSGGGHRSIAFPAGQVEQIPEWLRSVAARVGPLDGICWTDAVGLTQSAEAWDFRQQMQQHLYPAFALAKGLRHKKVKAASSSLVYVLSLQGLQGSAGQASLAASQGALQAMTRALALEFAKDRIRVNCLAVGPFEPSDTVEDVNTPGAAGTSPVDRVIPLLGWGTSRDVAQAAAFLLADTGRWITGTTMVVDGGFRLAAQGVNL